jgi:hypothetical protein
MKKSSSPSSVRGYHGQFDKSGISLHSVDSKDSADDFFPEIAYSNLKLENKYQLFIKFVKDLNPFAKKQLPSPYPYNWPYSTKLDIDKKPYRLIYTGSN